MNQHQTGKDLTRINQIILQALEDLSRRKISPKQAQAISQTASTLSMNIQRTDMDLRLRTLEKALKIRKDD